MLEYLIKGGYMMIPLLACSIITITVLFDRARAFFANAKVDTNALRANVMTRMEQGEVDEAAQLCASTPGPVSAVLLAGLQSYARHKPLTSRVQTLVAVMEKSMDDFAQHAISAVEKRLNVLATVGNAAPLLGMTGTVTGMILAFDDLARSGGFEVGGRAAEGISEALITTAAGLIIALIAIIPYSYFTSKANQIDLEIEEATTELLDFVATRVESKEI